MMVGGAPYERCLAVDVLGVGVGASSYERVAGLLATGDRGKVERCTLIPIPGINSEALRSVAKFVEYCKM